MKVVLAFVLSLIVAGVNAEELKLLRMGTLSLMVPSTWHFDGSNFRAEGRGPAGEGVIINYRVLKPGVPSEVIEHHWKTLRGFANTEMPKIALKNGEVLRPLTETSLAGDRVQFSTVTQGKKLLKDYYFLQYLLGSSRLMIFITVEGYGNAEEAASRFERILSTQKWDE